MAEKPAIFDSTIAHFREAGKPDKSGLAIEVHIIAPGWGSSGYYSPTVLQEACKKKVYPEGMHMHWDHPTAKAEKDQPARTLKDLVGVLTEDGHYDEHGWDGPGVYAKAKIFPDWIETVKAMGEHIGISHYVSGTAESGEAAGRKGPIIKELYPDALNTVDFVTVPGAGGHYRTLFGEAKKRESMENRQSEGNNVSEADYPWDQCIADQMKQYGDEETAKRVCAAIKNGTVQQAVAYGIAPNIKEARDMVAAKIKSEPLMYYLTGRMFEQMKEDHQRKHKMVTLEEVKKDPTLMEQLKKSVLDEAKVDEQLAELKQKAESAGRLEEQLTEARRKIAETAAKEYIAAEIAKTKLPPTVGKALTEALVLQVPLGSDGKLDTVKLGTIVTEAIKAKQAEVAAILKESRAPGLHDNGGSSFDAGTEADQKKAREDYRDILLDMGKTREEANRLAGIKEES